MTLRNMTDGVSWDLKVLVWGYSIAYNLYRVGLDQFTAIENYNMLGSL